MIKPTLFLEPRESAGTIALLLPKGDSDAIEYVCLKSRSGGGDTEGGQQQIAFAGAIYSVDRRQRL